MLGRIDHSFLNQPEQRRLNRKAQWFLRTVNYQLAIDTISFFVIGNIFFDIIDNPAIVQTDRPQIENDPSYILKILSYQTI